MPDVKSVLSNHFSLIAALLVIAIGIGFGALTMRSGATEVQASETVTSERTIEAQTEEATSPLGIRALGDKNAPVTITEHSSLTCGHCGSFHKGTFKELKETLIDTGKVRLIFQDFPLNRPALDASMIARCLPEERFFPFIQLLFETQDKWAYDSGYLKYLKQSAQLAGLSSNQFTACLDNEELRAGILENMSQENTSGLVVTSTPTFIVVNNKTMIKGAEDIEAFKQAIKNLETQK